MGINKSSKRKDKIHSNAKVATVEKTLAKELGVPGIKIVNKKGKDVRGDKLIKNLRKDWE
jgi:hypothetical protein